MPSTPVTRHPVLPRAGTGTRPPTPRSRQRAIRLASWPGDIGQQVARRTRKHPQAAFALAFVAGLLLARSVRRMAA